jgi:endonuclease V-like protein UPF0215 family
MAYLRRHKGPSGTVYIYVMQSYRKGDKVRSRVLEYLGREARITPARLRKAIEYWGVTMKGAKRKAKGRRR